MLPTDAKARKDIPIYSGFIKYFPDAIAAVAELSRKGNDQHNPGKPLHWDRSKSGDELDALARHLADEAAGVALDTDGVPHYVKVCWRALAYAQKQEEAKKPALDTRSSLDANPWRTHDGGKCPVDLQSFVSVVLRNGVKMDCVANVLNWMATKSQGDIMHWRYA